MKTKFYYDIVREDGKTVYCVTYTEFKKEISRWAEYNITERHRGSFVTKTIKGIILK